MNDKLSTVTLAHAARVNYKLIYRIVLRETTQEVTLLCTVFLSTSISRLTLFLVIMDYTLNISWDCGEVTILHR